MRHGSLFSGIGGFDLAADWMGWENVFHCEWNEFGQKVLKYYWPNAISYHDITKTDFSIHRGAIDILTGGFPCQPYSAAGKRLGKEDERHLWPEMLRAIREIKPTWVVGENVLGLVNWNGGLVFEEVQADLEAEGYEVQPYVLPAVSVNAPHRRDRVWFVARRIQGTLSYCGSSRCNRNKESSKGCECERSRISFNESDSFCNSRTFTYSSSDGLHDQSSETDNRIGQDNKQSGSQRFSTTQGLGNERTSPDTESRWAGGLRNQSEEARTRESNQPPRGVCGVSHADFAYTDGFGLWGQGDRFGKSGFINQKSKIGNWQNFPTVSPICTRDDGISDRLDSITFSKWRNQSIKASGNALVPQLVLQIFKAIESYERTNTHETTNH
jgi:DNA (cytosine-5)-methyltransferase 1